MKNYSITVILTLFICLLVNRSQAQEATFAELFQKAFECSFCPDTTQIALYTQAIKLGISETADLANFHNALVNRANLYSKREKYPEAIEDYQLAYGVMPDEKGIFQQWAVAYMESYNFRDALKKLNVYIDYLKEGKNMAAEAYQADQIADETEKEMTRQMRERSEADYNSKLAIAYHNRGICKGELRNHEGACADFRRAYDLGRRSLKWFIETECE